MGFALTYSKQVVIQPNVLLQRATAGPAVLSLDGRPAGARLARHGEVRSDLRKDPHKLLQSPLGPVSQSSFFSVAQYNDKVKTIG